MRFEQGDIKIVLETQKERDTLIKGMALICHILNDCIRENCMAPEVRRAGFDFNGLLAKQADFFERIKDGI